MGGRAGPAGPGRGAGGRWRGLAGLRDRPLRAARLACGDLAGGPPPTGTYSGPTQQYRPRGGRKSVGAAGTRQAAAHRHTQRPSPTEQATRRQGLAGLREDTPRQSSAHPAPPVWRAPEGPEGTGGLRGAAPNKVRSPSLAGGRALRRPEHPWGHKQHEAARPHRGRAAHASGR